MKECSSATLPTSAKSLWLLLLCLLPTASLQAVQALTPTQRQLELFSSNCVQCHARPGIGAPPMGNAGDWKSRQAQGEEAMLVNVVEGIRGMPPLGYCNVPRAAIRQQTYSDRTPSTLILPYCG